MVSNTLLKFIYVKID